MMENPEVVATKQMLNEVKRGSLLSLDDCIERTRGTLSAGELQFWEGFLESQALARFHSQLGRSRLL